MYIKCRFLNLVTCFYEVTGQKTENQKAESQKVE